MRGIWFVLLLLLPLTAGAASVIRVQFPVSMYGKADFESPVILTIEPGTSVVVSERAYGGFRKIKVVVLGKTYIGYAASSDLKALKTKPASGDWGVGGGFAYTRLTQGAKTFSTVDSVSYSISGYSGQSINPYLLFQGGKKNFWRLYGMYRTVHLAGTAKTDIAGVPSQDVSLEYKMFAIGGQAAWSIYSDIWYVGLGAEAAKATTGKVMFGSQDLSGDSENPDYFSGHALTGVQFRTKEHFSIAAEGRLGVITNQQPVITVMELGIHLLYWP